MIILSNIFFFILVLEEINERVEWLAEMEALGEGKKHRQVIHAQIADRLNEIKRLERANSKQSDTPSEI